MQELTFATVWRAMCASGMAMLLAANLAGCSPKATPPTNIPTLAPPTNTPAPPSAPTLAPREMTIECRYLQPEVVPVMAEADRATSYEWRVQDAAGTRMLDITGDAIRYSTPCTSYDLVIVTAWASNSQGLSAPTTSIITVPSPIMPPKLVTVPLDALAAPEGWTTETADNPPDFIHMTRGDASNCHTGVDCYRIQYDGGAGDAAMLWWPPCPIEEQEIRCRQEDQPGSPLEGKKICAAHITSPNWPAVLAGQCKIDVNESGNIGDIDRLTFRVRGEQGGEKVQFAIGDPSLGPEYHPLRPLILSNEWITETIDLSNVDLSAATVLFRWSIHDVDMQIEADGVRPVAFFLDDVQFEGTGTYTAAPQPKASEQSVIGQSTAEQSKPEAESLANLASRLTDLCWVAYSPTHFDPTASPARYPSAEDVREDLRVLRAAGFEGLVTYGSNYLDSDRAGEALDIPAMAQETGFTGMIVGVWDPTDAKELQTAEAAARYPVVLGYSVGNEGLDERYTVPALRAAMNKLRTATGKPVTTTEQSGDYVGNSPLWEISDWIFPNAHPYFAKIRNPDAAIAWTENLYRSLDAFTDKPVLLKEVGLPTAGDKDLSETSQAGYYQGLQETNVQFVVFEAFDAPWKHLGRPQPNGTYWPDPEPHWGVFTSDRQPKMAALGICQ